jgi:hypothetical protein
MVGMAMETKYTKQFSLFHRAFSYSLFNNPTYALLSYITLKTITC